MKKYVSLLISFLILGSVLFNIARADSDPVSMLTSVADQMIASLKQNKATLKTNPNLVYSLANRIIVPHADLSEMSKRVLPPQTWAKATAAQRSQFQREFSTLLVRTYASALAEYKDQTVKFFPVRGGYQGKSTVQVNSQIERSDGPSISVTYSLVQRGSGWRLYDMTVEGVSMLESFRSQFADKLSQGDMGALLRDLQQHNNTHGGSSS
jgi:phospholipid transport system substrate-binding protein